MIRVDLSAADIDYEDASGRVADFHALRHTFIPAFAKATPGRSNLARAGLP